jgi:hypothetical protein
VQVTLSIFLKLLIAGKMENISISKCIMLFNIISQAMPKEANDRLLNELGVVLINLKVETDINRCQ